MSISLLYSAITPICLTCAVGPPLPTAVNTDSQQLGEFGPPAVPERKAEDLLQVLPIDRAP